MTKNNNHRYFRAVQAACSALLIAISVALLSGCINDKSWQRYSGMIWHTAWHTTFLGSQDMMAGVMDSLKSVERSISVFDSNSLISKINRNEAECVDRHIEKVYKMSQKVNKASGGMFDPTLSLLIDAWGFGKGHTATADTANIETLLAVTGIDKTWIEDGTMHKESPSISFNFSAVAKGYGADRAAEELKKHGCKDLMLEIGGEVVCHGKNPDGKNWRIKIDTPDDEYLKETFGKRRKPTFGESIVVELDNEALATSGNYRNYRKGFGNVYGHTISPKTGRPITTDLLSASVIAPTCMEADAMATACMAMGSQDALAMLREQGLAGAFILDTGEVILNDKMKEHLAK